MRIRKILNPWVHKEGYNCFGCCPDNKVGIHMTFYEEGDYIISYWKPSNEYQGWIGTMHGGILSTLLDEVSGWVVTRKLQTAGYTMKLEIDFKKPVSSSDSQLTIKAHLVKMMRNIAFIEGHIEDSVGNICVLCKATYFTMSKEKSAEMGFESCSVEE